MWTDHSLKKNWKVTLEVQSHSTQLQNGCKVCITSLSSYNCGMIRLSCNCHWEIIFYFSQHTEQGKNKNIQVLQIGNHHNDNDHKVANDNGYSSRLMKIL